MIIKRYQSNLLLSWLCLLICFSTNAVFASQTIDDAIALYKVGLEKYEQEDYEAALNALQKAKAIYHKSGTFKDKSVTKIIIEPYGRGLREVTGFENIDYHPDKYIKNVIEKINFQKRQQLPPALKLSFITFEEPSKNKMLDGGESGLIMLSIENTGLSTASQVNLILLNNSNHNIKIEQKIPVGDISAQEIKTASFSIESNRYLSAGQSHLNIIAEEAYGFDSNEINIALQTQAYQAPELVITHFSIQDTDGDGIPQPQELINVIANIKNKGGGIAQNVIATFKTGEFVFLGPKIKNQYNLGNLLPNSDVSLAFSFFATRRVGFETNLPLSVIVDEKDGMYGSEKEIDLKLTDANKLPVNVAINARGIPLKSNGMNASTKTIKSNNHTVAVIIGNRNYHLSGIPNVDYAFNDAEGIKSWLINNKGVDKHNIIDLRDATAARFNETFGIENNHMGKLFRFVKPNVSEVFVYYSGHGAPDLIEKNAYFVPVDVNPNFISTSGYSLNTFYSNLEKLNAKHVTVVLDSCFSGNSAAGNLLKNISPVSIRLKQAGDLPDNFTVYSSSRGDQVSTWYHEKRHSLFTYYFLLGVNGNADINKNGLITSDEMSRYLTKEVPYYALRLNGSEQMPSIRGLENSVLSELPAGEAGSWVSNDN